MSRNRQPAGRTPGFTAPTTAHPMVAASPLRRLLSGAVGLVCLIGSLAPVNAAAPVVPLVTTHHHWDHHWFVWLPRHPVYEAVEVMSIESAGGFFRAVWVFFTERHGGKRQVHFFDDRQIVERFPGSHYRPIEYERSGGPGRAQSVRVAFTGLDDVPVEVAVVLADRPLTRAGAGLTDQSGHSADTLFLLFHRDRNALARSNEVRIGGRDYSFRAGDDPAGRHRFMAAYSAGIQIATVPFQRWSFSRQGTGMNAAAAGLSFAATEPGGGVRLEASAPGYRSRIAIDLNTDGALAGYRHDAESHRLAIDFDAALPLALDAPQVSREFEIRMNRDEPVARGEVVSEPMEGGRVLTWRLLTPPWTADYPFQSIIRQNGGGHALEIRSLSR